MLTSDCSPCGLYLLLCTKTGPQHPPSDCSDQPASRILHLLPALRCWALSEHLKPVKTLNACLRYQYLCTQGLLIDAEISAQAPSPKTGLAGAAMTQLPQFPHPRHCLLPDSPKEWEITPVQPTVSFKPPLQGLKP